MQIECEFKKINWFHQGSVSTERYTCIIVNKSLDGAFELNGDHLAEYRDINVYGLLINYSEMPKIPKNFGEKFKNITRVTIGNCGLKEISMEDLKPFCDLYYINLSFNKLEFLPADLFKGNKYLTYADFSNNNLQLVEPDILDSSEMLEFLDLSFNKAAAQMNNFSLGKENKEKFKAVLTETYNISMRDIRAQKDKEFRQKDAKIKELSATNENLMKQLDQLSVGKKKPDASHLLSDINKYLKDDDLKDFALIIEEERIRIHKMIFDARSSVFADMIKNNPEAEELRLTDFPLTTFNEVLNFVYFDVLPEKDFFEIYAVAEKLDMKSLKKAIEGKLVNLVTDESVFDLLSFALKHDIEDLKMKAMEKVQQMFPDKTFKVNLAEQCEELKKFADAKRVMDEMMRKLTMVD